MIDRFINTINLCGWTSLGSPKLRRIPPDRAGTAPNFGGKDVQDPHRLIALIIAAVTLLSSTPASALSSSLLDFFDRNGIYYYNPDGKSTCRSYSGSVTVYGGEVTEKIWTGLTSFLTPEQAAGIMGNMAHESGFNPARHEGSAMSRYQPGFDITGNSSIAYGVGLIQWSFGRRIELTRYLSAKDESLMEYLTNYNEYGKLSGAQFLQKAGSGVTDRLIALELDFLRDELNSKYSGFLSTSSLEEATRYFLEHVEIPKNPKLESHPERLTDANGFYNQYSGQEIEPDTSTDDNCTTPDGQAYNNSGDGSVSTLQSLVLQYAWPEYHAGPYTDRRSAYAEAIARRQAQGLYTGGNGGVDCGGFVTTLLQESGFAPDYNSGGGGTGAQENWVKEHGWSLLNSDTNTAVDTSILRPGDVAFSSGHTFVYVGNIPGFSSNIASASYGGSSARAPMAGRESLTFGKGVVVRWYRKP